MKVSAYPADWETRQKADKLAYRIDQKASYLKERYPIRDGVVADQYDSTGCGRGFLPETRRGFYKLTLDPNTSQPTSYVARHEHIENGHSDETLKMQVTPDGGKTYERTFWMDAGGQITSYTEKVKVTADGTKEYQHKPDARANFTNWVRRNRSVQTLTGLSVGGALGAWGGHALLGPTGAVLGGLLGANFVDLFVRQEQKMNNQSYPSPLEHSLWSPVDRLRTGVHIGGALAGVGVLMALSFAGSH